jgi:hypothetical protein
MFGRNTEPPLLTASGSIEKSNHEGRSTMSVRAHCVKKYVCEYAPGAAFNSVVAGSVFHLLSEYDVDVYSDDDDNYCGNWEINCEDNAKALRGCIAELKEMPPDEVNGNFESDPKDYQYTHQQVIDELEDWLKYIDKKNDVIRIHWF